MSAEHDVGKDEARHEIETQGTSMKDQLNKEVAYWSKGRGQQSSETATAPPQAIIKRRSPRSAGEPKKAVAPSNAGKAAGARTKPFSMSYDGTTAAEYIQYLLERGSR